MKKKQTLIRRLNIFAGPGAGKSTTASWLYSKLKEDFIKDQVDCSIELVQEYIKKWAYEGRKPESFDQWYVFSKQMHREDVLLRNNVDLIVTDSPILLTALYAKRHNVPGWDRLIDLALIFEEKYMSLNYFIDRKDREYISHGRYESVNQAKEMDEFIKENLFELIHDSSMAVIDYNDKEFIYEWTANIGIR